MEGILKNDQFLLRINATALMISFAENIGLLDLKPTFLMPNTTFSVLNTASVICSYKCGI